MDLITGSFHVALPMGDPSCVGEARRHAALLSMECGFNDVQAGRLALLVTELGGNLVRHARQGRLLLSVRPSQKEVEVLAIDSGPGIADLELCMGDGFSTGGTPGTGLGAVRRLASGFDMHSTVPEGTIISVRVHAKPQATRLHAIHVGAVSLAASGERICGDAWAFAVDGEQATAIVADGLGHGPQAAEAAREAVATFLEDPTATPSDTLRRIHGRLRRTCGAAVAVLHANAAAGTITTVGAGNVVGRVISGVSDRSVLTADGTAGRAIRTPVETTTPWPPHAVVILSSDGIATRWSSSCVTAALGRTPSVVAALVARDQRRGYDDATVAVLQRRN
ncbi:anti-sigma regulatory factor [Ramlibacter sp. G-1-2-2]|uniref:Anti-sigma regulatory factor n=1 Tax=Ramlibacter agri TaxID=2728837 RepID=A0A848H9Z2_9BURK|nr:ATP-binding protein [Ramlibacter agri]NML44428.1 anti-sigma regulatory factor [Ramlibacter agri]